MGTANMISPLVMGLGRSMVVLNATVGAGGADGDDDHHRNEDYGSK